VKWPDPEMFNIFVCVCGGVGVEAGRQTDIVSWRQPNGLINLIISKI